MDTTTSNDISAIETAIAYSFRNKRLLAHALTHSSYKNERKSNKCKELEIEDNERLEFLGDTILSFVVSKKMFVKFQNCTEGELSKYRSILVSKPFLFVVARKIKLAQYMHLGKGEARGTLADKKTILANAVEALIAAVYLDGGMKHAEAFIEQFISRHIELKKLARLDKNYKSILQEYAQKNYKTLPVYATVRHNNVFHATVTVGTDAEGTGSGKNKREAEKDAARNILETLSREKKS